MGNPRNGTGSLAAAVDHQEGLDLAVELNDAARPVVALLVSAGAAGKDVGDACKMQQVY